MFVRRCFTAPPTTTFVKLLQMSKTYLYGPAVCCKPDVSNGGIGLALLYPARELSAIGRSQLLRGLCYDARFVIAPLGQTVHAMRASVLASAVAKTL
jgi:hypothetical protein